ncbi:MAG: SGNH/GDSL hydrolase family protein [Rhodocyclaceae bacterium]|nr:SGNH/GDSL hydrolase family protein [Rhodocyclaceae bacterium]
MKYSLATLGLGPLLYAQGQRVRRTIPSLPEPDGQRHGSGGQGPRLRVLILGDSAAAGVGAPSQEHALSGQLLSHLGQPFTVPCRLVARTGDTTAQVITHLLAQAPETFDVALTSIGVNDVTARTGNARWVRQQRHLIETLTGRFGIRHVLLTRLPPMQHFPALPQPLRWYLGLRAGQLSALLHTLSADHPACEVLDINLPLRAEYIAEDGFHPAPPAYALWACAATKAILARHERGSGKEAMQKPARRTAAGPEHP